jgi:hypothetical protein
MAMPEQCVKDGMISPLELFAGGGFTVSAVSLP